MKKTLLNVRTLFYFLPFIGLNMEAQNSALKFISSEATHIETNVIPPTGSSDRTIEMWIKGSNISAIQDLAVYGTFSAGQRFSFVTLNGKLRLETGGNGNGVTSLVTVLDNSWHHVAVTVDSVTATTALVTLYVDGVANGTGTFTVNTTVGTSGKLFIATRSPTSTYGFTGSIDDVRVWDVVRSGTEIMANMNTELCTYPTGLTTYLKINEGVIYGDNSSITSLVDEINPTNTNIYPNNFIMSGSITNFVIGKVGIDSSITITDATLESNEDEATSYQWVLLADGETTVIDGATAQTFTPIETGTYAVQITKGECTETSEAVAFNSLSSTDNEFVNQITVSPNPTNNFVNVNLRNNYEKVTAQLISVTGSLVSEKTFNNCATFQIEVNQATGLYFLNITTDNGDSAVMKVVKY